MAISPLFTKLNLKAQQAIWVLNAPASFELELVQLDNIAVRRAVAPGDRIAFGMAFAITQAELDAASHALSAAADGDALIWIVYPKKSSKRFACEFNRDSGWTTLAGAGFETVRMVAIDDDWSALRFRRVEHVKSLTRQTARALTPDGRPRTQKPAQQPAKKPAKKPAPKPAPKPASKR